jgi:hypothetical protein
MPSSSDFYDELSGCHVELKGANARLDEVKAKLDALKAETTAVRKAAEYTNKVLVWGFGDLVRLADYANQALAQNAKQNDTIICNLEHISKNTCDLVNEAHAQTKLQKVIKHNTTMLADLYAATHADAALARERLEKLREELEECRAKCCPPPQPKPPCDFQPCPLPPKFDTPPPKVDTQPPKPPGGLD